MALLSFTNVLKVPNHLGGTGIREALRKRLGPTRPQISVICYAIVPWSRKLSTLLCFFWAVGVSEPPAVDEVFNEQGGLISSISAEARGGLLTLLNLWKTHANDMFWAKLYKQNTEI